jgi:hypothetical protein
VAKGGSSGSGGEFDIFGGLPDSVKLGLHLGAGETMLEKRQLPAAEHEFKLALKAAEKGDDNDSDVGECLT